MRRSILRPILPILFAGALLLAGCSVDHDSDERWSDPAIRGTVVDANGAPVVGARLLLDFAPTFAPADSFASVAPFPIEWSMPVAGEVRITARPWRPEGPERVLVQGMQGAGVHQVDWDRRSADGLWARSGWTDLRVETEQGTVGLRLFQNLACDTLPAGGLEAWCWSDSGGRFRIEPGDLPFGFERDGCVFWSGELPEGSSVRRRPVPAGMVLGVEIGRFVRVRAVHAEAGRAAVDSVYVDEIDGADLQLRLER